MKMFTLLFFHFFHQMLKLFAEFREDENEVRTPRNTSRIFLYTCCKNRRACDRNKPKLGHLIYGTTLRNTS